MSTRAKLLLIYKYVSEGKPQIRVECSDDEDAVVRYVHKLLTCEKQSGQKKNTFQEAHEILLEDVIKHAWDEEFNTYRFEPLLPPCSFEYPKIDFCEGRPWPTEQDKTDKRSFAARAYCPRTGVDCRVATVDDVLGARIYPIPQLPWEKWCIAELLSKKDIKPLLWGLNDPNEYPTKLAGWINRLVEIRERLKCSLCGEIMRPNLKYAKNLARYNMTVASCSNGDGHDQNIYLNHCWGCNHIIDSRESMIKVQNYYICIWCGSGPQQSDTYSQGDKCPKDGHEPMKKSNENPREYVCEKCGHKIKLPPAHRLTGKKKNIQSH